MLVRAIQKNYPVLFESRQYRYYFNGDESVRESIDCHALKNYRDNPKVILLVDHQPHAEPPICRAFTVAPVSPDKMNSHEFRKTLCRILWIPKPTAHEIVAMNSLTPKLKADDLNERINLFGPITRLCLDPVLFSQNKLELQNKISSFKFQDIFSLSSADIPRSKSEGLSWWILHVDCDETLTIPRIDWASHEIFIQVTANLKQRQLIELEDYISEAILTRSPTLPSPSKEYEVWVNNMLITGQCKLQIFKFHSHVKPDNSQGEEVIFNLDAHMFRQTYQLFNVADLCAKKNTLFVSTNPTTALCDSAVVIEQTLYLFQTTIGADHGISQKGVKHYFNQIKSNNLKELKLIYIIPEYTYFNNLDSQEYTKTTDQFENLEYKFIFGIYLAILQPKPRLSVNTIL